ncbi:MAG TPA: hypothetical protein PKC43_04270 [Phycisphaerales bacterium]|nr:hypothetical protein [Phycisphaerales bacterium]HMP36643.1 hypothetical protein [Phycisphaerales bacterium]
MALAAAIGSAAGASVLASALPASPDGAFTDAWASGGSYFYGQTIAAQFTLAFDSTIDGFTVWGSSENFLFPGLNNVAGVEVVIWNSDFSLQVLGAVIAGGDLSIAATGNANSNGGIEYRIGGDLAGFLAAGTYHLNVGAILLDPDGDAFSWSTSVGSGFSANFFDGLGWAAFDDLDVPAFELLGSVVPAPGALALFGALGAVPARRRRR